MKKKTLRNSILGCFLALLLGFQPYASAFEVGGQEISLDVGNTFVTKYVFRGIDTFAGGPATQPYATIGTSIGKVNFAGGFWGSYALEGGNEALDEQDYWGSIDVDVFDWLNVGTTYTYYDFFNASSDGDINEFAFSATLNYIPLPEGTDLPIFGDKIPVSVGYMGAYDFGNKDVGSGGIDDGWYHQIDLGIEVPIPYSEKLPFQEEGLALAYTNTFGFYSGNQIGFEDGLAYWTQTWGVGFSFPFNVAVTPTFAYQVSKSDTVNPNNEFYFMIDTSISF